MTFSDTMTGKENRLSIKDIEYKARLMRAYTLTAISKTVQPTGTGRKAILKWAYICGLDI